MFLDARTLADARPISADICIVGAGPAGISLALQLERLGRDVLLIESGGLLQNPAAAALSHAEQAGLPYFPLEKNRHRALGGTSALWAGWCRPLDEIDLAHRDWVPNSGWPISRESLESHYEQARKMFQLADTPEAEVAVTPKGPQLLSLNAGRLEHRWFDLSPPTRFGTTYRRPLRTSRRIRVLTGATVRELIPSANGRAIESLVIQREDGRQFTITARQFVLAAGGVENARLLLVSRQRLPQGIGNDRDLVGRFFMEHIHFDAGYLRLTRANDVRFDAACYWRFRPPRWQRWLLGKKPRDQIARLFLHPATQTTQRLLNYNVMLEPVLLKNDSSGRPVHRTARQSQAANAFRLHHTLEQIPAAESRITLSQRRDPLGVPMARVEWQTGDTDRDSYRRSLGIVGEEFSRSGLAELVEVADDNDAQWPPQPLQGLRGHHMGTTRMSAAPATGVVDPNCRVHGVENLYIAGSSVFPTSGSSTPTFTLVALSLRLADHLAARRFVARAA